MMQKELKQKWLEALRSGKYTQTQLVTRLESENSFCCLGVLCDISGVGRWGEGSKYLIKGGGELSGHLFGNEFGLDDEKAFDLSRKNDGGASFLEIADIIEADPTI